jgi:hypothetical protein
VKRFAWILVLVALVASALFVSGCVGDEAASTLDQAQTDKLQQAADLVKAVPPPRLPYSIERENIAKRLEVTNSRAQVGWIYLFETGRVVGRFPVRGKVTSGSKRLTSTEKEWPYVGQYGVLGEAPDEMGAYGASGEYIFWFDPAGNYHQFKGNYFYSTKPYQIQLGAISVEVDKAEEGRYAK